MTSAPPANPGVVGACVSGVTGAYSFFGDSLPFLQWIAAIIAVCAGIASVASVIKHWNRPVV